MTSIRGGVRIALLPLMLAATLNVALAGVLDDEHGAVSVLQARSIAHKASYRAMEVREQLLADWALAVERFDLPAPIVEPYQARR